MLAAVAALVWPREREPEYKGRALSVWIQGGASRTLQAADRAAKIEAIQHIGTNALPHLLKWIEGGEFPKQNRKVDAVVIKVLPKPAARSWLTYRSRKFL